VHILVSLFSFGLVLPLLSYVVSIKTRKAVNSQAFFYKEWLALAGLAVYILLYVTWGDHFISTQILPGISGDPLTLFVLGALQQVIFYFLLPFIFYLAIYGFTLKEAGLFIPLTHVFSWQNIVTFVALSAVIVLFQYFFNEDLELLWEGEYPANTLFVAIPLLFLLLFFKVGLAYGFFFRSLMQSRLSIGLNSKFGGMVISLFLFGLVHLPMLWHEGVPDKHGVGQFPGFATVLGMCIGIISISALFFAIIWRRSKNLWLVMGLYAVLELLPNLERFIAILM
jgi:membrane protease YdiL (CAAX protease family)